MVKAKVSRGGKARLGNQMNTKSTKIIALILMVLGAVMVVSGATTYSMVNSALKEERITVADDAQRFAGKLVAGPFTAFEQANIIEMHALNTTGGKTYAELDREDPLRAVAMNGSFLRASLFTSVVAFGVSVLVMGVGLMFVLAGWSIRSLASKQELIAV
jgi:ABC-type sugar transport system permease subunit